MKAVVAYERPVDGTRAVAEQIAASLRTKGLEAEAIPVDQLDPVRARSVDLLIIGGPAHEHGAGEAGHRGTGASGDKWKRSGRGSAHPSDRWSTLAVVRPRSRRRRPRMAGGPDR